MTYQYLSVISHKREMINMKTLMCGMSTTSHEPQHNLDKVIKCQGTARISSAILTTAVQ